MKNRVHTDLGRIHYGSVKLNKCLVHVNGRPCRNRFTAGANCGYCNSLIRTK